MKSDFYTTKEVAAKLKLSAATVARLERSGELQGTRFGGSLRFSAQAIAALIERGKQ